MNKYYPIDRQSIFELDFAIFLFFLLVGNTMRTEFPNIGLFIFITLIVLFILISVYLYIISLSEIKINGKNLEYSIRHPKNSSYGTIELMLVSRIDIYSYPSSVKHISVSRRYDFYQKNKKYEYFIVNEMVDNSALIKMIKEVNPEIEINLI